MDGGATRPCLYSVDQARAALAWEVASLREFLGELEDKTGPLHVIALSALKTVQETWAGLGWLDGTATYPFPDDIEWNADGVEGSLGAAVRFKWANPRISLVIAPGGQARGYRAPDGAGMRRKSDGRWAYWGGGGELDGNGLPKNRVERVREETDHYTACRRFLHTCFHTCFTGVDSNQQQ